MRKVGIIVGSKSDLPQCIEGLEYLAAAQKQQKVTILEVAVASIHRNTDRVYQIIWALDKLGVDALIVGAGWANALPGMVDALLRYKRHNDRVVVIGVAFEDEDNFKHTQAATLSITELPPGNQVVFNNFIGPRGFLDACRFAVNKQLPKIKLPKPKQHRTGNVAQMLNEAIEIKKEKEKKL